MTLFSCTITCILLLDLETVASGLDVFLDTTRCPSHLTPSFLNAGTFLVSKPIWDNTVFLQDLTTTTPQSQSTSSFQRYGYLHSPIPYLKTSRMLTVPYALFQTFRYGMAVLKALCIHKSSGTPSGLRKNMCHSPRFLFLNVTAQAHLWSSQEAWDDPSRKPCFLLGWPVTVDVPTTSPCNVPEKGTTCYFDT